MYFRHLRRGVTALCGPKHHWFSFSFGSRATFGYTTRKSIISVPKASDGTSFSFAIHYHLSHRTFGSTTTSGYKSQPSDDSTGKRELRDFCDKVKAMVMAKNHAGAVDFLIAKLEAVKERVISGHKGFEEALYLDAIGMAFVDLGDIESVGSIVAVLAEVVDNIKESDYDMSLCHILLHMGLMYSKLQKFEETVAVIRKLINIMEINGELNGKSGEELGKFMLKLALERRANGHMDEAIRMTRDALRLLKHSRDENSLNLIRNDLAKCLIEVGREREGREILEECISIAQKTNGKEDMTASLFACNLGASHLESRNFGEAEKYLRIGLENLAKTSGTDHLMRTPMMQLAVALAYLQQGEEAEQFALKAVRISEKLFGEDSLEVADALDCLWMARVSLRKDDEEQLEALKRSLRIQEKAGLCESEQVFITLERMVLHLDRLGRKDEKLLVERRLSDLQKTCKNHETLSWTLHKKETASIANQFCINPIIANQSKGFSVHCVSRPSEPQNAQSSKTHFERAGRMLDNEIRFERELKGMMCAVEAMKSVGNRDGASKLLSANYKQVKENMDSGSKNSEELAFLGFIIKGYLSLGGNRKIVEPMVDEMTKVIDGLSEDDHRTFTALKSLGSIYFFLEKFDKSVLAFERLINIDEKKCGKIGYHRLPTYLLFATSLVSVGKASQAKEYYNRAFTISAPGGDMGSANFSVLCDLADLLIKKGKTEDAETLFLRILDSCKKLSGKYDGRAGQAMRGVAKVKLAMGDTEEAIRWSRNAIQVTKDSMAITEVEAATIIADSAKLLYNAGREQECLEILRECLLTAEKTVGKEHTSSIKYMNQIARSHYLSKDYKEAERILRTCVEISSKMFGADNPDTAFQMLDLTNPLFHLKQYEEADELASKALKVIEIFYGEESHKLATALGKVVTVQSKLLMHGEGLLEKLNWLLRIQEESGTSDEVLKTLEKIAICLDKLGRKEEKLAVEEKGMLLVRKLADAQLLA